MSEARQPMWTEKWGVFAAIATPLTVVLVGSCLNSTVQDRTLRPQYVSVATTILAQQPRAKDPSDKELREWAVDILRSNSPIELKDGAASRLIHSSIEDRLSASHYQYLEDIDDIGQFAWTGTLHKDAAVPRVIPVIVNAVQAESGASAIIYRFSFRGGVDSGYVEVVTKGWFKLRLGGNEYEGNWDVRFLDLQKGVLAILTMPFDEGTRWNYLELRGKLATYPPR